METEALGSNASCQILGRAECEPDSKVLENRFLVTYVDELIKEELLSILNLHVSLGNVKYAVNFQGKIVA